MSPMPRITFLGTGSAFPSHSYNSCFILYDEPLSLIVDAGGGNGVISQLERSKIDVTALHHFFITHAHTDHILGAVWVVRAVINAFIQKRYEGKLSLYGNSDTLNALDAICKLTLLSSHYKLMQQITLWTNVENRHEMIIENNKFYFFNVGSENVCQTGFRLILKNGRELVCLGDEAITERNISHCLNADYVICGAFCRKADASIFRPYEKHHHTVLDVAQEAQIAGVKNLILVHCEDTDLVNRQTLYAQEASSVFGGKLIVPHDLETLIL